MRNASRNRRGGTCADAKPHQARQHFRCEIRDLVKKINERNRDPA
jgi:hypothetical protein